MKPTMQKTAKPDAIALLAALKAEPPVTAQPAPLLPSPANAPMTAKKPGARAGTRQIAGHFPEATLRALKHVMAEDNVTLQALLDEAIQDFLVKKGRSKLVRS